MNDHHKPCPIAKTLCRSIYNTFIIFLSHIECFYFIEFKIKEKLNRNGVALFL